MSNTKVKPIPTISIYVHMACLYENPIERITCQGMIPFTIGACASYDGKKIDNIFYSEKKLKRRAIPKKWTDDSTMKGMIRNKAGIGGYVSVTPAFEKGQISSTNDGSYPVTNFQNWIVNLYDEFVQIRKDAHLSYKNIQIKVYMDSDDYYVDQMDVDYTQVEDPCDYGAILNSIPTNVPIKFAYLGSEEKDLYNVLTVQDSHLILFEDLIERFQQEFLKKIGFKHLEDNSLIKAYQLPVIFAEKDRVRLTDPKS